MGTRGITKIVADGRICVSQYGQWDHYPDAAGVAILRSLRNMDMSKLRAKAVSLMPIDSYVVKDLYDELGISPKDGFITFEQAKRFKKHYPWLNRDMGYGIVDYVYYNDVDRVLIDHDESWCEGFYTVNLDNMTFTSLYGGVTTVHSLDALPDDDVYLEDFDEDL